MKEYSFDIRKNDPKLRWRGISPEYSQWVREHGIINLEGRDRSTLSKTNIHTKITLEDDKLRITVDRESEKFDRRLNSFSEGENEIYLSNISSIKFKVGYAIALNIHQMIFFAFMVMNLLAEIAGIISLWLGKRYGLITNVIEIHYIIFGAIFLGMLSNITMKCVQITYKNDDPISSKKYKKIVFPISSLFYTRTPKIYKDRIDELINEIRYNNPEIKYKKDKLNKKFTTFIIICLITIITVPFILRYNYLLENDLSYNLEKNLLDEEVLFEKATITDIKKERVYGKDEYTYVFKIEGTGEEFEVKNEYGKKIGETYNICITNYYKKKTNKFLANEYTIGHNNGKAMNKWSSNTEYFHDYIGNKTYIFNILENSDIPNYRVMNGYYKDSNAKNTLYNFIYSDKIKLDIEDDIDFKNLKSNKYISLEKIGQYESEYGTCYILKAIKSNKTNYIMYMENKDKKIQGELDAILIDSDIDRKGYFSDDDKAISSFKNMLPEVK